MTQDTERFVSGGKRLGEKLVGGRGIAFPEVPEFPNRRRGGVSERAGIKEQSRGGKTEGEEKRKMNDHRRLLPFQVFPFWTKRTFRVGERASPSFGESAEQAGEKRLNAKGK